MIEYDLIDYLLTDATLKTLIGWSSGDPKIYPVQAPHEATEPYILFSWGVGDTTDEILGEDRIQLTAVSDGLEVATNIRERLYILLHKEDEIQDTAFYSGSADYYIYNSRFTGGSSVIDSETKKFYAVSFYNVKYKKKT